MAARLLLKHLRSVYGNAANGKAAASTTSPNDSSDYHSVALIEAFLQAESSSVNASSSTGSASSSKDSSQRDKTLLFETVIDLSANVRPAQASSWLVLLALLCDVKGEYDARIEDSQRLELASLLWPVLLRQAVLNPTALHLDREGVKAARQLICWGATTQTLDDSSINAFELTLIDDYIALASQNDATCHQLEEVLLLVGKQHPKQLFALMSSYIKSRPEHRLGSLCLLSAFLKAHSNLAHHLLSSDLLLNLTLAVLLQNVPQPDTTGSTQYCIELQIINYAVGCHLILLPRIISALSTADIAGLLVVYAKIASLVQLAAQTAQRSDLQNELTGYDQTPPAHKSAAELTNSPNSRIHVKRHVKWALPSCMHRLYLSCALAYRIAAQLVDGQTHASRDAVDLPAREMFTYLYGLIPKTFIEFIRSPSAILKEMGWTNPIELDASEPDAFGADFDPDAYLGLDLPYVAVNSEVS